MCIFSFSFRPKLIFIAAKQSDPLVKEKKREAFSLHIILLQYLKKKKSRTTKIRLNVKFVAEIRHYKICLTIPRHLVSGFRLCRNKVPNVLARYWFFPEANSSK